PDMVVVAKALSGGFVPVGAVLMRDDICSSVYTSAEKAFVHASTFGENTLAMRAGLATLSVLEDERLGSKAQALGKRLRDGLTVAGSEFEMVREVRGVGMMCGIEFQAPRSTALRLLFSGFAKAHPGLFGQICVSTLFNDSHILTQMAGNNYMVLKLLPPLIATESQIDQVIDGFKNLFETIQHSKKRFWGRGMKIGSDLLGLT
ncbi:MAG: aminotransferase class III-fold pyridoxal phosphate-dependent enzyme, partial [Bdellovibrionales bacterium]|nr:aminotransferase class III-fold pyridoxal phosphate-dependent enzyme [Bdellovibrionales bacterium]